MAYIKKNIILILCFISFFGFSQTEEVIWHTDINSAIQESISTDKPLMLFFTGSDWCGWCKKLKADVLDKTIFAKWAKNNVVAVELDYPRRKQLPQNIVEQNAQLKQMFPVRGYPTIFFCEPVIESNKITDWGVLGNCGYNPAGSGAQAWINHVEQFLD